MNSLGDLLYPRILTNSIREKSWKDRFRQLGQDLWSS